MNFIIFYVFFIDPLKENDGNFIMYPAAVSGNYPNNKRFSNCSKNNVLRCLKAKAKYCFQRPSEVICGNFKVCISTLISFDKISCVWLICKVDSCYWII